MCISLAFLDRSRSYQTCHQTHKSHAAELSIIIYWRRTDDLKSRQRRRCGMYVVNTRENWCHPVWSPIFRDEVRQGRAKQQCDRNCTPVWTAFAIGHHLRTIQTIADNVYVSLVGPRRSVSKRQGRRLEIFLLTYLRVCVGVCEDRAYRHTETVIDQR